MDIVLEVPEEFFALDAGWKKQLERLLENILERLQADGSCSCVKDVIERKTTIEFRFAGLHVDLTACIGSASETHSPSRFSHFVKSSFEELPAIVGHVAHLVVDCVKRAGACHSRKGTSIGAQ